MDELSDMMNFLNVNARIDLKSVACRYILGLTASDPGRNILISKPELAHGMVDLIVDPNPSVAKDACCTILNLSADERGARMLLSHREDFDANSTTSSNTPVNVVEICISLVLNPESSLADPACMVLSNLTRPISNIECFMELLEKSGFTLDQIVNVFTRQSYNKTGANLHYLGPLFSNLSQSARVRRYLLDKERCVIQRLLPFTEYDQSEVRRGGIVGTLRNCAFDVDQHSWLLGPQVDILPRLLLPLAGPEVFPDDDMDKLPLDLQYLDSNKTRESDPDIRKMLLETLLQLCATKKSRELMRERNVYLILREFHKWEQDRSILLACENVIDILIRTEEEIGEENIRNIEVPEDLQEKFLRMDEDYISI